MKSINTLKGIIRDNKQIRKSIRKRLLTIDLKPENKERICYYLEQIDLLIIRTEEAKLQLKGFID